MTENLRLVKTENPKFNCKKCHTNDQLYYYKDETYDGAYDRYNYECKACGHQWRVVDESD